MTVSSTLRKAGPFNGNGVTTAFPFAFKVFAKTDIQVVKTDAAGVQTSLVLDSDYSVSLNLDQDASPGGTITYPVVGSPLAVGLRLDVVGSLVAQQSTDITNLGNFLPQVHEDAFDRDVILVQQLEEKFARAVIAPVGDSATLTLPTVAQRAGRVLVFDLAGNVGAGVESDVSSSTVQANAAAASAAAAAASRAAAGTSESISVRVATEVQSGLEAAALSSFSETTLYASGEKGAVWDPATAGSLFQDSGATTPASANGDPVGGLLNKKSGTPSTTGMATSNLTARPTLEIAGSLKGLVFDAANDALVISSLDLSGATNKVTFVVAMKQNSASGTGVVMELGTAPSSGSGGFGAYINNGTNGMFGVGVGNGPNYVFRNDEYLTAAPRTFVATVIYDPLAAASIDKVRVRVNGVSKPLGLVAANGTVSTNPISGALNLIFGARNASSLFAAMTMYYALAINRELTAAEIANVEARAALRAGISAAYGDRPTVWTDSVTPTDQTSYYQTSVFARACYDTEATSVDVGTYNNIYGTYPQYTSIGVFINGMYYTSVSPGAAGAVTTTVTLPAGMKRVEFVNGLQSKPSGTVLGTFLAHVKFNARAVRAFPSAQRRAVFYGDSIGVGSDASPVMQNAYFMRLREIVRGCALAMEGWGFRALHDDAVDGTARTAFVNKIASYGNVTDVVLVIGRNDFGLAPWTAAAFGTAYAATLDEIHSQLPNALVWCVTPILSSPDGTQGDYRTQIVTAVSTRTAYATYIDGSTMVTTADLSDGVHPNTVGHRKMFLALKSALSALLGV